MAIRPIHKPIVIVLSIFLIVLGCITGIIGFVQNFGDIKINEYVLFLGLAMMGTGIAVAAWFVVSYAIDFFRELMGRKS